MNDSSHALSNQVRPRDRLDQANLDQSPLTRLLWRLIELRDRSTPPARPTQQRRRRNDSPPRLSSVVAIEDAAVAGSRAPGRAVAHHHAITGRH